MPMSRTEDAAKSAPAHPMSQSALAPLRLCAHVVSRETIVLAIQPVD